MIAKKNPQADTDSAVQEMLDRHAVLQVLYNYCKGLDRFEFDLLNGCWWPDGTDDHGIFRGTGTEFCEWVFPFLKETTERTQHNVLNTYIEIRGSKAHSECNFIIWHRQLLQDGAQNDMITGGRYIDDFERRRGIWKIKHRMVIYDWDRLDPVRGYYGTAFDSIRGLRGREDYSYTRRW